MSGLNLIVSINIASIVIQRVACNAAVIFYCVRLARDQFYEVIEGDRHAAPVSDGRLLKSLAVRDVAWQSSAMWRLKAYLNKNRASRRVRSRQKKRCPQRMKPLKVSEK